jgi:ribose transport system permease protein
MTPQPELAAVPVPAAASGRNWSELAYQLGALLGLLVLCAILAILSPSFLTSSNLAGIARQTSVNALLALGMLVVILTGGIDLSVGAVLALAMVVLAMVVKNLGLDQWFGLMAALMVGAALGAVNGLLLTRLHLPHPFISTLGMMNVARGVALVITGAAPISALGAGVVKLVGNDDIKLGAGPDAISIPYMIFVVVFAYLAFHFFLNRTVIGRNVYATGGNPEAARLSGVPVDRILVLVYTISGLMAGVAAVVLAGRTDSGYPNAGLGFELDAISAVIIGGTSFFGGVGTVSGTLIGALIMGVLRNGLNLLSVDTNYQTVVIGAVIIGAVYVDVLRRRAGASR